MLIIVVVQGTYPVKFGIMRNQIDLKSKLKSVNTLWLVDKVELRKMEFFNQIQPGDAIPKEIGLSRL